jgi:hypothetical protein
MGKYGKRLEKLRKQIEKLDKMERNHLQKVDF